MQAESLFEAAVLAVRAFKKSPWIESVGPAAPLEVEVRAPIAKHTLTMRQIESWLDGATASPNETVKKNKLREMLAAP